jgi:hypothetical protein
MVEPGWISTDERIPEMRLKKSLEEGEPDYMVSDYVLVWDGIEMTIAQAVFDAAGLYWSDQYAEVVKATLWMPLPTLPEQ